jgi:fumarylpyruvate hydrolase
MTNLCFPAPAQAMVPVAGAALAFLVHWIYCVGRNYAEHAREMGADERELPFFFCKPADAVLPLGQDEACIPYPDGTEDLQHEVELVVALGAGGYCVTPARAGELIWGCAVGIDLTRRDLQAALKRSGRPWEVSKGFDHSAPLGAIRPRREVGALDSGRIWLNVNGACRQQADLSQMIWSAEETLSQLSRHFRLAAGDLVFTGTPAGVGRLEPGDRIDAGIERIGTIRARIGDRGDRSGAVGEAAAG